MARGRPTLLMTRPLEASERFVTSLQKDVALDDVVISPVLAICPTGNAPEPGAARGVIFSSAQAVHLYNGPTDLPAYCVGPHTTEVAKQRGFKAEQKGRNAEELVQALIGSAVPEPLLHLHGTHTRGKIAARLAAAGQDVRAVALYDQQPAQLSCDALALLDGERPVILPLFSPRSARLLSAQAQGRAERWVVSMSEQVAENAKGLLPARHLLASRPDAEAMRATITALYHGKPPVEGGTWNA